MFNNIYRGRRVLITGHTGFKGSWLTAWLLMLGAEVAGYSAEIPTVPSNYLAMDLANKINDFRSNIKNSAELQKKVDEFKPEIIFHLAAQSNAYQYYNNPVDTFESNVLGTLYILEAARLCDSVKVLICVTSGKCYSKNDWVYGYREVDSLGGKNPYSASKSCAEHIAQAYFESFYKNKIACATVRSGSVIGGGDWASHSFIPNCARAWNSNETLNIENPLLIYPWLYVLEPLSGYLWLGSKLFQAGQKFSYLDESIDLAEQSFSHLSVQAYNFGATGHESHSVLDLIKTLSLHWTGLKSTINEKEKINTQESPVFKLCTDKALTKLQWRAILDFEETVRYTAEWYSAFYSKKSENNEKSMLSYSIGQISAYTNAADNRGLLWAR